MALTYIVASGMAASFILLIDAIVYLVINSFDPIWFWVFFAIGIFLGILTLILGFTGAT